jgi:hypothetical protein
MFLFALWERDFILALGQAAATALILLARSRGRTTGPTLPNPAAEAIPASSGTEKDS